MAYTVVIYPHGRLPLQSAFNYNKVQQRRKICSGKSLCIRNHAVQTDRHTIHCALYPDTDAASCLVPPVKKLPLCQTLET